MTHERDLPQSAVKAMERYLYRSQRSSRNWPLTPRGRQALARRMLQAALDEGSVVLAAQQRRDHG